MTVSLLFIILSLEGKPSSFNHSFLPDDILAGNLILTFPFGVLTCFSQPKTASKGNSSTSLIKFEPWISYSLSWILTVK